MLIISGKYYSTTNRDRYYGNGMFDVIRLSDGQVIKRVSEFLHKEEFRYQVCHLRPSSQRNSSLPD